MGNGRDYDENAARFAGETVGRAGMLDKHRQPKSRVTYTYTHTEGQYDRADRAWDREEQSIGDDYRRGEQAVENAPGEIARDVQQGFNNTVQGIENVPSDIGSGIRSAANWIGDKIGGAENEGRRAEQNVENSYNRAEDNVERRYDNAEQGVDRFNQGVENSYDQGERQGRREGW